MTLTKNDLRTYDVNWNDDGMPIETETFVLASKVADELEPIWRLLTAKPSIKEIRKAQELIENMQNTLRGNGK